MPINTELVIALRAVHITWSYLSPFQQQFVWAISIQPLAFLDIPQVQNTNKQNLYILKMPFSLFLCIDVLVNFTLL